jgi:alpha-tubulin suppressor-like RCC1 family protein
MSYNLLLIDPRVIEPDYLINSLDNNTKYIKLDSMIYNSENILNQIRELGKNDYVNVGLVKINDGKFFDIIVDSYQYFQNKIVELKNFLNILENEFKTTNFDIISCNSYNNYWTELFNKFNDGLSIKIRSSVDITGYGGNWILESHNIELIGLYFTENIKNYPYSLDITDTLHYIDANKKAWLWGSNSNSVAGRQNYLNGIYTKFIRNIVPDNYKVKQISMGSNSLCVIATDNNGLNGKCYHTFLNFLGDKMINNGKFMWSEIVFDPSRSLVPDFTNDTNCGITWVAMTNGELWSFGAHNGSTMLGLGNITGHSNLENGSGNTPQLVPLSMIPTGLKPVSIISIIGTYVDAAVVLPSSIAVLFKDNNGQNAKIFGCGDNDSGSLGLGHSNQVWSLTEIPIPEGKTPNKIFGGYQALFVLMTDNTLYASGYNGGNTASNNTNRNLNGQNMTVNTLSLVTIPNLPPTKYPVSVSCGETFTMVLMNDGSIYRVGHWNDKVGTGNTLSPADEGKWLQVSIPIGKIPDKLVSNSNTAFVKMTDKTLWYTGIQVIEDTSASNILTQVTLPDNTSIKHIYGSTGINIAFMDDNSFNTTYITGYLQQSVYGTMVSVGYGSNFSPTPYKFIFPNFQNVKQISSGNNHTMAIMDDINGTVYGFGNNFNGQLGLGHNNSDNPYIPKLVPLPSGKKPIKVSCGIDYSIILMSDGTVYGCGSNGVGQLGTGNTTNYNVLTPMNLLAQLENGSIVTDIQCSGSTTVIMTNDTECSIWTCGDGTIGHLGNNSIQQINNTLQKMQFPSGKTAKLFTVSNIFTVVAFTDNTIYATGRSVYAGIASNNVSQNDIIPYLLDVNISMLPDNSSIKQMASGQAHLLILLNDLSGSCYSCGSNLQGQLALGHNNGISILTKITNIPEGKIIEKIYASGLNSIVKFKGDNLVYVSGDNTFGQLGHGIMQGTEPNNSNILQKVSFNYINYYENQYYDSFWTSPISNICFPKGTPINTDQGIIDIDKIDKSCHTINNSQIKHITKTISPDNYLICIEKNALGKNIPSKRTIISKNHKILYKNNMISSKYLLDIINNTKLIYKIDYDGSPLYNILLNKHDKVKVNNLICETLDPKNGIAKLYNDIDKLTTNEIEKINLFNQYNKYVVKQQIFTTKKNV